MKGRNLFILVATVLLASLGNPAIAQTEDISVQEPAIGGYSPVSYFTKNIAEPGSKEFAVVHDGAVYYLASADQIEVFEQNPDKYKPRHMSCSYSLALGKVLPLDPTSFKIVGDSLLMFHKHDDGSALARWNSSTVSEEELIRRADANNLFRVDF